MYLVYGMHHCLNVVTGPVSFPAALLIRAVEPLEGSRRHARRARSGRRARRPVPDARLAAGPGLVGAAFGIDRALTGIDLCDPASGLRLEPAPDGEPSPQIVATPRVGIALCGRAVGLRSVAVPRRGEPVRSGGRSTLMDARSIALLEFPAVRARLAEKTSFDPSRRLAEALVPSADEVIVRRGLDETDQARALLQERPGVGIGAAHDIDPWVGRAVRGGRLDPAQFLEIVETLDAAARLATALAEERRPLLRDLGRRLHPLPALRSTLAAQLRSRGRAAGHRLTAPRAGCGAPSASPTTGCAAAWTRWSARSWAARSRNR